jgi:hypothetical protein
MKRHPVHHAATGAANPGRSRTERRRPDSTEDRDRAPTTDKPQRKRSYRPESHWYD